MVVRQPSIQIVNGALWVNAIRIDQRKYEIWKAWLPGAEAALAKLRASGANQSYIDTQESQVLMFRATVYAWETGKVAEGAKVVGAAASPVPPIVNMGPENIGIATGKVTKEQAVAGVGVVVVVLVAAIIFWAVS